MKKEEKFLIKITKKERDYLVSQGCLYPDDLHSTEGKGKKKTIYATESWKVLNLLSQYRNSVIAK